MPNSDIAGSRPGRKNPTGSPDLNLVELMGRIQTALAAIERDVVHSHAPYADPTDNRIVLDDRNPRFADLHLALSTCKQASTSPCGMVVENSATDTSSPARLTA